jgi:two-component system, sporulation sensor kinase B
MNNSIHIKFITYKYERSVTVVNVLGGLVEKLNEMKDLLSNVLFILFPLFLFQFLWADRGKIHSRWNPVVVFLFAAISALLCLSFPVEFFPGFYFDLRQIPFILGTLYGGLQVSAWLFITIFTYRFVLGGDGIYVSFITVSLIFFVLPYFSAKYKALPKRKKLLATIGLSLIFSSMTVILSDFFSAQILDDMILKFVSIQAVTICITTYLIELILESVRLREKAVLQKEAQQAEAAEQPLEKKRSV